MGDVGNVGYEPDLEQPIQYIVNSFFVYSTSLMLLGHVRSSHLDREIKWPALVLTMSVDNSISLSNVHARSYLPSATK